MIPSGRNSSNTTEHISITTIFSFFFIYKSRRKRYVAKPSEMVNTNLHAKYPCIPLYISCNHSHFCCEAFPRELHICFEIKPSYAIPQNVIINTITVCVLAQR